LLWSKKVNAVRNFEGNRRVKSISLCVCVCVCVCYYSGPMREEDVTPGTIYPLMGKLICLLPEPLKKKLCCVTPLGQTVSGVITESWLHV